LGGVYHTYFPYEDSRCIDQLKFDQRNKTSVVGGQLPLALVHNASNSGSDLKETICLFIPHLQKTETGNGTKTITTLLWFAQAISEADNGKKAPDAAAGQKYVPPRENGLWIQKLFGIIANGNAMAFGLVRTVPSKHVPSSSLCIAKTVSDTMCVSVSCLLQTIFLSCLHLRWPWHSSTKTVLQR